MNKPINKFYLFITLFVIIFVCLFRVELYKYAYNLNLIHETEANLLILSDDNDTSTTITPILDNLINKNKNIIYCSSFQTGWNDLTNNVIRETIEIESPPCYFNKINELTKQPALISEDAYLTLSGVVNSQTNGFIKAALKNKFPNIHTNNDLLFEYNTMQNSLFIFSVLFKNLSFVNEFTKIEKFKFNCIDKKISYVEAFGIENNDTNFNILDKQIEIFYENNENKNLNNNQVNKYQFVIKLKTKSESDEVIISNFEPESSLEKTYNKINKCINNSNNRKKLSSYSSVIIPKIDFDIIYNYNAINNKKILNVKYKDYAIVSAKQKIRFNLNEKGVYLFSNFMTIFDMAGPKPINFLINEPFFIYLKTKFASYPYFMAYIANDELLKKVNHKY
ncbi:MAG: hypothetical protein ACD_59C00011G0002 [uncultured bacterium]|nr:MAG: hypothetical protein ACD_59C00011G0002 [uncultured bacterium]